MAGKVKVPRFQAPREFVAVDPEATKGAIVGVNLLNPDGSIWLPPSAGNQTGSGQPPSNAFVLWRNVLEVPQNIVELAQLTGGGYPWQNADGTWELRRSGRATIPFAYGDASPVPIYITHEDSVVVNVRVAIGVAFDGVGASVSVGSAGDPDFYLPAADVNPAQAASYEALPDLLVAAGAQLMLYITPGAGAAAGSGRVIIDTVPTEES